MNNSLRLMKKIIPLSLLACMLVMITSACAKKDLRDASLIIGVAAADFHGGDHELPECIEHAPQQERDLQSTACRSQFGITDQHEHREW